MIMATLYGHLRNVDSRMGIYAKDKIVLALLFPIISSANEQGTQCPMRFQHMNSSCYYIESVDRTSRDQAQITCESLCSQLVDITSVEEDEFIRSLALNESSTCNYWIGLDVEEKTYRWMDGSPLTFTYWDGVQNDGTDCIRMRYNSAVSGFRWNDRTCKDRERAICEGNLTDPVCLVVPSSSTFNHSCYIIPDGEFLRDQAKEYCEGLGAHLAYIESAEENSFIIGLMGSIRHCYIGLTRRRPGSIQYEYSWISGEPLDYSNFGNLGVGSECIQINNNDGYSVWTSAICKELKGYICERPDVLIPELSCLDITSPTDLGISTSSQIIIDPSVPDCHGDVSIVCSHTTDDIFSYGSTNVTCNATDSSGNTGYCNFTVSVMDTEKPFLRCRDVTSATDFGLSSSSSVTLRPNATDNVDGIVSVNCSHTSNDTFSFGETNVACKAIDAVGNVGYCNFVVTVTDIISPMLNCSDTTAPTDPGVSTSSQITIDPSASDNVDLDVSIVCSHTTDDNFSYGNTTVSCSAMDSSGNTRKCKIIVSVIDTEEPSLNCRDVTSVTDVGLSSSSSVTLRLNATDNVDGMVSVNCSHTSTDTFLFGETNVTCKAVDEAGNVGYCNFVVNVTESPKRRRQLHFMMKKEHSVPIPDSIIGDVTKETGTKCATLCLSTKECTSFAYHALDGKCIIANSSIGTASEGKGFKHYITTT